MSTLQADLHAYAEALVLGLLAFALLSVWLLAWEWKIKWLLRRRAWMKTRQSLDTEHSVLVEYRHSLRQRMSP